MESEHHGTSAQIAESTVGHDNDFEDLPFPVEPLNINEMDTDDGRDSNITTDERKYHLSIYPIRNGNESPGIILPVNNIKVKIINYRRSSSNMMIRANPNLYTIEVEYLQFKWCLQRRYKHFQHLHNQLQLLRTSLNIPFPSKTHREKRASFKVERFKEKAAHSKSIPRFPLRPEALVSEDQMDIRMSQLEDYLKAVLENVFYRNHQETLSFLEISFISFVEMLGEKRKEGWLKKYSGDNSSIRQGQHFCCCYAFFSQSFKKTIGVSSKRWIFVKDTFIGYLRPETGQFGCIILMDQDFKVRCGASETGLKKGLIVSNSSRQLILKNPTRREAGEWVACIQQAMNTTGKDFIQFDGPNRFGSFVPIRENNYCTWFVDGCHFMTAVADAIESAKEEIFIADWWLSPEIYMKRPVFDGNRWRLDTILQRKAEEGVHVYILLYKEVELALGINSLYSKKALSAIHKNIKVLRHPDHIVGTGTILWAHHEKLVVIDQSLAFVSGIDLCYGRWDNFEHRLTDLGSVTSQRPTGVPNIKTSHTMGQQKPGALFHLAQTAHQVSLVSLSPSVPVITEGNTINPEKREEKNCRFEEPPEEKRSISQNSYQKDKHPNKFKRLTFRGKEWAEELKEDGKEWVEKRFATNTRIEKQSSSGMANVNNMESSLINSREDIEENSVDEALNGYEGSTKLWIGKDYTNFIVKDFENLDQPLKDSVDRTTTPRMPWHDIGCAVWGESARDIARHFIQRWNAIKVEKVKYEVNYPFLVPKSYQSCVPPDETMKLKIGFSTLASCQVLRSSTTWSTGSRITEDSIHSAYIHSIRNSKHFIYIENQFFISLAGDSADVTNGLGKALYERILLAFKTKSRFRVIVVLPLLPGFEGQIGTTSGIAMGAILHWNYASISRGNNSLLGKLREANIDPLNYISFYGLRTHSLLKNQLVTELIYVHSKLIIIDDRVVICGSANINDRSMMGKRDSEIAMIIEDTSFVDSYMDGKSYRAGKFALTLRKRLFREHLGLLKPGCDSDINIDDPISDSFYKDTWIRAAAINTKIYEEVFRCIPCDEVTSFSKLREFQSSLALALTEPNVAQQKLTQIQGHLVLLPLHFMREEDLSPAAGTAEALLPTSLWT